MLNANKNCFIGYFFSWQPLFLEPEFPPFCLVSDVGQINAPHFHPMTQKRHYGFGNVCGTWFSSAGVYLPGSQHAENYYFWVDPPTIGLARWGISDLGTRVGDIWCIGETPMRWTDTVRQTWVGNVAIFWTMKP